MKHPHTLFPAVETAEGAVIAPLSTLQPTAGISFELWKKIEEQANKRAYYAANKEKILASRASHYAANREKIRADTAAYRASNLKKVRACETAYRQACRQANPEKIRAREAAYYAANRKKIRASQAVYRKANRKKLVAHQVKYERDRCKTDPLFRLTRSLRARLLLAFKSQQVEKTGTTFELTGCTKEELRQHLVSKFRDGMTLENHGKVWHIDHIRPCSSFDLSDPNQAILCFHYSNLQPLFADENLRKGDRWKPTELRPLAA